MTGLEISYRFIKHALTLQNIMIIFFVVMGSYSILQYMYIIEQAPLFGQQRKDFIRDLSKGNGW